MQITDVRSKTVRDGRRGFIGWSIAMVLLIAWMAAVFPSIRDNDAFSKLMEQYPESLKKMLGLTGVDITTGAGYLKTELFSFMLPLILVLYGVGFGARALAGEEEAKTVDLLLATPISRRRVVIEKIAAYITLAGGLAVVLVVALVSVNGIFDMGVPLTRIVSSIAVVSLLAAHFMAVSLAVGALTGRRAIAISAATGFGVGSFVWNGIAPLTERLDSWRWLSPFAWAFDHDPMLGPVSAGPIVLLSAMTISWLAIAVLAFDHRDLGT